MRQTKFSGAVIATGFFLNAGLAAAEETWMLNAAGSAAAPIDETHDRNFGAGAIGELGVYRSFAPALSLGMRVSGGGLTEDDSRATTHGDMSLGAIGPALRLRPFARGSDPRRSTGLWLEGTAGPGIADGDVEPIASPGLGYMIDAGDFGIGPAARYIHVFKSGDGFEGADGSIGTLGVEVSLFDKGTYKREERREFQPEPPMVPAARVDPDADRDGIPVGRDQCPSQPETVNGINDHDGCPDTTQEFLGDRLVIDERIFFDYDESALRPEGESELEKIASLYKRTGFDWSMLRVQGHADSRGSEPYNEELSERRAQAVKDKLLSLGIPETMLDTEAYGETRPEIPAAKTEAEHQQNRRVEFLIVRTKE